MRRLFSTSQPSLVPYWDAGNKKTVYIPKAELNPGVVLVKSSDDPEPKYMDSSELKMGPVRHAPIPADLGAEIAGFAAELADVYPQSVEEWEEGFLRDQNPEFEIAGWIHLAAILRTMTNAFGYGPLERTECFHILIACFTGDRDTVRNRSDPKILPSSQVDQAIRYFFEGGYK